MTETTSFEDAICALDKGGIGFLALIDNQGRLAGILTDGDIRRAILKHKTNLNEIVNFNPRTVDYRMSRKQVIHLLKEMHRKHMPTVDENNVYMGVVALDGLEFSKRTNWVVIMAGGLGTRLRPYTDDCPKPLLKVGGRPILDTILANFIEYGFSRFYFAVNYKADMIQAYFGDGSRWGVDIRYVQEDQRLGTAGALSLLPERPSEPLVVMNGDVLTRVNFEQLLSFHAETKAFGTMCVREYDFQVPFGVTVVDNHRLLSIEEKPVQRFFVNAGIYVLEPNALDVIPSYTYMDMPTVFSRFIESGSNASVFPIREYWLDLGRLEDFTRAQGDFLREFQ